ncbi:MAG: inositol-3-phosphate synthase [Sulfolobales archaeon]|nr:inositol-3-phosphate synthase [Ignisphaera sp.]MCX8199722.1 inositol-3-phosphate synthase [Sulfolobales archaeon]MDW8085859.1 inositol-3-phosphate synthase [Ignisphaera sp.]
MVRVGIVGVGNIAAMFIQAIEYYGLSEDTVGLIHEIIDGYKASDIRIVYAVDVARTKVGKDVAEAIFAKPNTVPKLVDIRNLGVTVRMGRILDGVAAHMVDDFQPAPLKEPTIDDLADELKSYGVDVLVNLLPVGSSEASRFYAEAAARAGVAFINCIPEFLASERSCCELFERSYTIILGDDIKGQLGSTIVHRTLTSLVAMRGAEIAESYQLNVGGNTDFKNMLEQTRLASKKISKTAAVTSTLPKPEEAFQRVHAGPSGYIPFLGNTKVSYIYIKARGFLGIPVVMDLKLVVDDKAMASAVLMDVVRLAVALKKRGVKGCPHWASAPYFKHPPKQARNEEEALINLYTNLERIGISIEPRKLHLFGAI